MIDKGRIELNAAARLFLLTEDSTVMDGGIDVSTHDVAQKKFIAHRERIRLSLLRDRKINQQDLVLKRAIASYNSEKDNMDFSKFLLNVVDDGWPFAHFTYLTSRLCKVALEHQIS